MFTKRIALRTISLFFALLIGATAISCGSDGTSELQPGNTSASTTASMTAAVQDNLPELDLEGRT